MATLQGLLLAVLLVAVIRVVHCEMCKNEEHPVDSTMTMISCKLNQTEDITSVPDVEALELTFTELNTIDFTQFSLARPTLKYLRFDMTYVPTPKLKDALNGITAPNLRIVNVIRDLDKDSSSIYIYAETFSTFTTLQNLDLRGIGIGTLDRHAFRGLFGIEVLDLRANYLIEVPEHALQDCQNLTVISLQDNFIEPKHLLEHSFTGPLNLHWLNLENNKISHVPSNRFSQLGSLSNLILTRNELRYMESQAFNGLTDLHYLALSHNKLRNVPSEALKDIPNLYSLDLSVNELDNLEDGSFESLTKLEVLNLKYTNLGDISRDAFKGLHKLRELHLTRNQIQVINATTFMHVPNVEKIYLSQNKLKDIPADTFSSLQQLRELYLSGNELRQLAEGIFEGLTLEKLFLDNNRWNCTCELLWLFQWIHDNEDQLTNEHELYIIQCTTPEKYQHYSFFDLRLSFVMGCEEELTVPDITTEAQQQSGGDALNKQELAGVIAGSVLFLVLLMFIVVIVVYVRRKKSYRFWKPSQTGGSDRSYDVEREQRLARHRTPSWCKDPETVPVPVASPRTIPPIPETSAPPAYSPEQHDNKVNQVFAFDNMALETSMVSQNGMSPTKSNGSAASPSRSSFSHPASSSSPRDHTTHNSDINVDINKNMNAS